ncbi:hypothetical protein BRADI_2g38205v3 [Brachypodium distachyon]|uniref:Uncharacterized protein n=1 Tax=Brachypodium distachyon TaxID=15368 RepID=A0A2K2DCI6_BRADI|nr:hypothetical protein BRADI_2g38205v3 [Brachypodium distachyon]
MLGTRETSQQYTLSIIYGKERGVGETNPSVRPVASKTRSWIFGEGWRACMCSCGQKPRSLSMEGSERNEQDHVNKKRSFHVM